MKLYPPYRNRRWSLPADPARQAEIAAQHQAMPVRLEIEVLGELKQLGTDDLPADSRVAVLRDGLAKGEVEVWAHPVGPRGSHRLIVSVDRRGGGFAPCYHGTLPHAAAASYRTLVPADLHIATPIWE